MAEDNPQEIFLLENSLALAGIGAWLECVGDGERLLARFLEKAPEARDLDLIVLDVHLPKLSAEEVLTRLREEGIAPRAPIVLLSSLVSPEQRRVFEALGAHGIFVKPMDLDEYVTLARTLGALMRP